MRTAFVLFLIASFAQAQDSGQNRVTFSGGWSRQIGRSYDPESATGLGLSYGRRFHKFMEAEAGVFTALQPAPDIRGAHYFLDPDDRFIWVPFGIRFIAPMYLGRIRFSGGGGGLYEEYSVSNPEPGLGVESRHGWGGYFVGEAAVALDRRRRFWIGAAPRWFLANPRYARDRWFMITGDVSFRF